ncbi:MAG TPA: chloride channel protein, partial [Burkholderiaceae bacterium]|nr:chloride channel protein [Burkholderiaceae bacterium]
MRQLRTVVLRLLDLTRAWERYGILVAAALIGVLGALTTVGFRLGLEAAQKLLYGRSDDLVRIAADLPVFWRIVTPALGGLAAGAVLAWARRTSRSVRNGEYMEAIVIGEGNLGVRSSLTRALSSAITVVSGGAIGREGSMV